jgi:uracil-DNA glycosylase
VEGTKGQFEFQLQCYGRERCIQGNTVIKETDGPHKRTIWYTEEQLFKPLAERRAPMSTLSKPASSDRTATDDTKSTSQVETTATDESGSYGDLISGLEDPGWKDAVSDAIASDSFQNLESFLAQERASGATIYPPQGDIFSAFNLCPFDDVKVVIVGQDPYHGPGQGHGLAFSVRHGVKPPPSLRNIVREAMEDVSIDEPKHGNLEHWAGQGVLLLNTVLTVRRGEANSHSKVGWEDFTDEVIRVLNEREDGLVFLLWGNPAAKKAKGVDDSKHVVIKTSHPSPLGATKTNSPFLGSRCFSRTNEALESMDKSPIDWSVL